MLQSAHETVALAKPVSVIVVERNGDLRVSQIKEYSQLELSRKCKCKSPSGFEMRAEWAYSGPDEDKFTVELWAREDGPAGQENKYEFPPPVDTILFFGGCALVAKDMTSHHCVIPLTLEKWDKMYNFLFGGFDTLANYDDDDDLEADDLDSIHASSARKTKDGYLKDGFVIDNNDDNDAEDAEDDTDYDENTSTLTDDDDDDDDDNSDDDDNDDDDDDNSDDDNSDDDNSDNDTNDDTTDEIILKQKCNYEKNKIMPSVSKKRNAKQPKEEPVGPSFELMEETYEYFDD